MRTIKIVFQVLSAATLAFAFAPNTLNAEALELPCEEQQIFIVGNLDSSEVRVARYAPGVASNNPPLSSYSFLLSVTDGLGEWHYISVHFFHLSLDLPLFEAVVFANADELELNPNSPASQQIEIARTLLFFDESGQQNGGAEAKNLSAVVHWKNGAPLWSYRFNFDFTSFATNSNISSLSEGNFESDLDEDGAPNCEDAFPHDPTLTEPVKCTCEDSIGANEDITEIANENGSNTCPNFDDQTEAAEDENQKSEESSGKKSKKKKNKKKKSKRAN